MRFSSPLLTIPLPLASANLFAQIVGIMPVDIDPLSSGEASEFNLALYASMDLMFESSGGTTQEARWNRFSIYPPALEAPKVYVYPELSRNPRPYKTYLHLLRQALNLPRRS